MFERDGEAPGELRLTGRISCADAGGEDVYIETAGSNGPGVTKFLVYFRERSF